VSAAAVVAGVLDEAVYPRDAVFASLDLLVAVEEYRDGLAVPALGWAGDAPETTPAGRWYSSFRLYARTLDDVPTLRDALERSLPGDRLELITQADAIAGVRRIEASVGLTFWILATVASCGYLLALAATLWASVGHKRREISVLRLAGFRATQVTLFPVWQAVLCGVSGGVLALAFFLAASVLLNAYFAPTLRLGERICRLLWWHPVLAIVATVLWSAAAATVAGRRAAGLDIAEALREE
jgi:putative ABC transport system permease protein